MASAFTPGSASGPMSYSGNPRAQAAAQLAKAGVNDPSKAEAPDKGALSQAGGILGGILGAYFGMSPSAAMAGYSIGQQAGGGLADLAADKPSAPGELAGAATGILGLSDAAGADKKAKAAKALAQ